MNIDSIRIKNSEKAKQEEVPRHYLMPVVEVPYVASNYSRKKSVVEAQNWLLIILLGILLDIIRDKARCQNDINQNNIGAFYYIYYSSK